MSAAGGNAKPPHMAVAVNQYRQDKKLTATICTEILRVMNSAENAGIIQFITTGNNILFKNKIKTTLPDPCKKFLQWFEANHTTDTRMDDVSQYFPESMHKYTDQQLTSLENEKKVAEDKLRVAEEKLQQQDEISLKLETTTATLEHEKKSTIALKEENKLLENEIRRLQKNAEEAKIANNAEKETMESRIRNATMAARETHGESMQKTVAISRLEERLAHSRSMVEKLEKETHSLSTEKRTLDEELRMEKWSGRSKPNTNSSPGMIKRVGDSIGDAVCHVSVGVFRAAFGDSKERSPKRKRDDD